MSKNIFYFVLKRPKDGRYFARYSTKRVQTAWSLAGAKIFIGGTVDPDRDHMVTQLMLRDFIQVNLSEVLI